MKKIPEPRWFQTRRPTLVIPIPIIILKEFKVPLFHFKIKRTASNLFRIEFKMLTELLNHLNAKSPTLFSMEISV